MRCNAVQFASHEVDFTQVLFFSRIDGAHTAAQLCIALQLRKVLLLTGAQESHAVEDQNLSAKEKTEAI